MKKLLLTIALSFTLGFAYAEPAPQGRIYDATARHDITPEALISSLQQADIVLIGEKHDDSAHHEAELWLLQQTAEQRNKGSVLLEMIDASQQKDVTEVQQWLLNGGKTSERRLAGKMNWNGAWDWTAYSGVMNFIMRQPATVLAANPPRSQTLAATGFMPHGKNSSNFEVRKTLAELMDSNHGSTDGLVSMQQFKDHTMTANLMAAPKPAWLLAGSIHTSKHLGVPLFLKDAAFPSKLKVVILTDKESDIDPGHGDYIWYLNQSVKH
ncbi:MAG: ChaN family lipoprotein [Neisseria sp.]|uniref:ChaN family lipoprotein n=1 Tax=Neisseria sp. TaxID=192066 RepID=UPI0026DC8B33|nr:ChaN family lipoprotein [Neisseria sp.]MDO4640615.1 ChaN family lipoprotein [Neisseria sp.]